MVGNGHTLSRYATQRPRARLRHLEAVRIRNLQCDELTHPHQHASFYQLYLLPRDEEPWLLYVSEEVRRRRKVLLNGSIACASYGSRVLESLFS